MIGRRACEYCRVDISKIENYDKAINDNTQIWHIHHRLEIRDDYINSKEDLIMMNLYYNRPANELIFLTHSEHIRIHLERKEVQEKARINKIGKKRSKEFKKEQSVRMKGVHKGQHWKIINGKRVWYG